MKGNENFYFFQRKFSIQRISKSYAKSSFKIKYFQKLHKSTPKTSYSHNPEKYSYFKYCINTKLQRCIIKPQMYVCRHCNMKCNERLAWEVGS